MMRARLVLAVAGLLAAPMVAGGALAGSVDTATQPAPASAPVAAEGRARNIILFIGDGMGVATITAARIYDGQLRGEPGEENALSFERFPNVALVKTYNTNQQVPDSAGTATAITTGVKTRAGVLNIGPAAARGDCAEAREHELTTIAHRLAAAGRAVGIVTTTTITHATPAALYAHAADRNWERDSQIPAAEAQKGCRDIAAQLAGFPFKVALGGGRDNFFGADHGGRRTDAQANLVADWAARTGGRYVTTSAQLAGAPDDGAPLLGLFAAGHMSYALQRAPGSPEPSLIEMTLAAIERLEGHDQGYFLMVEGGRIDHGHHEGRAGLALSETREFAQAIEAALGRIDLDQTLVLVTADHSHSFAMAGYPRRGNPILDLVETNDERGEPEGTPALAQDGLPYTTLGYLNGPGARREGPRQMPETGPQAVQQAAIPLYAETHSGEDVPLYAIGPGAGRVRGVIEQNLIHTIMLKALGEE